VDWQNSHLLGVHPAGELTELKARPGGDIVVFGSGGLIPTLVAADLIDEYSACSPTASPRRP
jgi:dihydrofolate reductase